MKKNIKNRFGELILGLAQTYGINLTQSDLEIYWRMLRAYPIEEIEKAVMNYCCHPDGHRFIPKPGEIITFLEGSSDNQSLRAWSKVLKAIKEIGSYQTVIFDDPLIHAVIYDMGGWCYLCQTAEKELPFRAHEFKKRYVGYIINKPNLYPKQLIGVVDADNSMLGYQTNNPPILIGDEKKAWLVFCKGQDVKMMKNYQSLSSKLLHKFLQDPHSLKKQEDSE